MEKTVTFKELQSLVRRANVCHMNIIALEPMHHLKPDGIVMECYLESIKRHCKRDLFRILVPIQLILPEKQSA